MKRTAIRLFIGCAIAAASAATVSAQVAPGAPPLPGTGDSTKISAGNRANNAEYNHLISGGEALPKKADRPQASRAVPATAADITVGAALRDSKGVPIGTVASISGDQVVVDTGTTKIGVPLVAFGKDDRGLLLGITAAKFSELVAKAKASN